VRKYRNQRGRERLSDAISCRVSASQRTCLEKLAQEKGIDLGEAIRELLDAGIEAKGIKVSE
jgi:hypothetical protein